MSKPAGPIYEVTVSVDREIVDTFDPWLARHVEEMLAYPGFIRADTFTLEDDEGGRALRVTHYYLESDADLDRYLAGPAGEMRQAAVDRFGERATASRRVLRPGDFGGDGMTPPAICLNCRTVLGGQYCGNCGQRARSRLISIWELVSDAFGDLFELDSRIWRTLIPLIARPGKLTRDYLEGRRARFMPPFRTYLVLSIVFFLVAFFDPQEELGLLFEPEAPVAVEPDEDGEPSADQIGQEILRELSEEGIIVVPDTEDGDESTADESEVEDADGPQLNISTDGASCDIGNIDEAELPAWLAKRLTKERLIAICERMRADDGRAFLDQLLNNTPTALFVLLPLMALILKILYPLSKRYYVEHLLFVVHYHAFVFLILILQVLFTRLGQLAGLPEGVIDGGIFATAIYIPVYLYKSMRRVYEQGRAITLAKFIMLMTAYFMGFAIILVVAALFAAFSI